MPVRHMRHISADSLAIAGLVPLSSVDWPGKLAATVFCQGCPWKCPYCHNHRIIDPRVAGVVPWSRVRDLLQRRRGLLDGVVFSGGEALRQEALVDACREVHQAGYAVGLHSAGAYPSRLARLLDEGLVDWVGQDIKALPQDYQWVSGVPHSGDLAWRSLELVVKSGVDYEVRVTVYPDTPSDPLAIAQKLRDCGVETVALQQARADGAPKDFIAQREGWDQQCRDWAHQMETMGFTSFLFRPAHSE